MWNIGRNKLMQVFLLACVMMQVVALMPHHHHGDSDAVCLNYTHLSASTAGDCCGDVHLGDSHDHSGTPFTACTTAGNLVIAQPEFRDNSATEIVADLPDCGCGACVIDDTVFALEQITAGILSAYRLHPEAEPYLRIYLTDATPCRAPDFIA